MNVNERRGFLSRSVLVAALMAAVLGLTGSPAHANPVARPTVAPALAWLAHDLDANGGRLPSSYDPTATDWGLTLDVVLALTAGGQGHGTSATSAMDQVDAHVGSYVTGADFGSPDDRYAGAVGKALLATALTGRSVHDVGGHDLEAMARSLLVTTGPEAGRFSDVSQYGDYSNGFGQALNVMALARTSAGVPASALVFLRAQQCPAGGFRLFYDAPGGCKDDASADPDATAFAIDALLSATADAANRTAIASATHWLVSLQRSDGGFGGVGPTAAVNAGTTGLVGQALAAVKHAGPAAKATTWIEARQLTATNSGSASADIGAIALDDGALAAAKSDGITALTRDQWRRSTSQAVLALGLPTYSQVGLDVPGATSSLSATNVSSGQTLTVSGTGFAYGEAVTVTLQSDPVVLTTVTADGSGAVGYTFTVPELAAGAHQVSLSGQTSTLTVAAGFTVTVTAATPATTATTTTTVVGVLGMQQGALPATGDATPAELIAALGLLAAGAALVGWSRRRAGSAARR